MLLVEMASSLATGNVPSDIIDGIRLGRMTASQKPDGGVREIVVGDIIRRLVARTMAKQVSKQVERATAPFQYTLSTKAGCECITHILQTFTDLDDDATIVSIDEVGAYDLISRNNMLRGLLRMENGDQVLPFVRCFYGRTSTYLWEDEVGDTQEIPQGEGGEQGDPLTPLLFSLGKHPALEAIQRRLRGNEKVVAFLDDIVVVCSADWVVAVEAILREELKRHAHIDVHLGKTQEWNRGGVAPRGIEELVRVARLVKPDAIVWKGDPSLPRELQGICVLGAPIGSPEYVADQLQKKSDEQETLFTRIPRVEDTQACWLLLLMCASTRANFWLRVVSPEQSLQFAERHDAAVWFCLRAILGTPEARSRADHCEFPIVDGRTWADISGEIQGRSVLVELGRLHKDDQGQTPSANMVIDGIARDPDPCFQAVRRCEGCLVVITGHGPQAEVAQVFGHELLVELGGGHLEGLEEEQRKGEEKETGEENNHHTTHK